MISTSINCQVGKLLMQLHAEQPQWQSRREHPASGKSSQPGVTDCLEAAHLRVVPFPLVTLGNLMISGLSGCPCQTCLSHLGTVALGLQRKPLSLLAVIALGSHHTFPCTALSFHCSLTSGNNPHVPRVQSPNLLLISPVFIWIRNSIILGALQPNLTSGLNSPLIFILPVSTHQNNPLRMLGAFQNLQQKIITNTVESNLLCTLGYLSK